MAEHGRVKDRKSQLSLRNVCSPYSLKKKIREVQQEQGSYVSSHLVCLY